MGGGGEKKSSLHDINRCGRDVAQQLARGSYTRASHLALLPEHHAPQTEIPNSRLADGALREGDVYISEILNRLLCFHIVLSPQRTGLYRIYPISPRQTSHLPLRSLHISVMATALLYASATTTRGASTALTCSRPACFSMERNTYTEGPPGTITSLSPWS